MAGKIRIHRVKPTVRRHPGASMEGVLVGKDGSIIHDDAWMHRDLLDEEEWLERKRINDIYSQIIGAWKSAKTAVVFTGAGMSTESGLPDFRSKNGLWKTRPKSMATMEDFAQRPQEFYSSYQWWISQMQKVQPNTGHFKLAEMERAGYIKHIITQNVDGLHQQAGSAKMIELHGSLQTVSCLKCGRLFDSKTMLPGDDSRVSGSTQQHSYGKECLCRECGGFLRPDIVMFGEALPEEAIWQAMELSRKADFFVVLGSSLTVSPANHCPLLAVQNGAKLLIINQEPTEFDELAEWVIKDSVGDVLSAIVKLW